MAILKYFVFSGILFKAIFSFLNENEQKIGLELSKRLKITCCIIVENEKIEKAPQKNIKAFSSSDIFSTVLNYDEILDFMVGKPDRLYRRTAFVFKLKNFSSIEVLFEGMKKRVVELYEFYKISPFTWLIFLEEKNSAITIENHDIIVPYDCEFIIIQSKGNKTGILTEVFTVNDNHFFNDYGSWNEEHSLDISDEFFYLRRRNLNQSKIIMVSLYNEFSSIDHMIQEMLHEISQIMNFQFQKLVHEDIKNNDTLNLLLDKEMDKNGLVFGQASYFLPGISELKQNTRPLFKVNVDWFIKHPGSNLRSDFYIQPFQSNIWFAIIYSIVTGSLTVVFMQHFVREKEKRSIVDNAFLGLEYFCNQSGNDLITNFSLKIASLSLRIISMVVIASFGAVVTSFLAVKNTEMPFLDLETFFQNGEYKFMIYDDYVYNLMLSFSVSEEKARSYYTIFKNKEDSERVCHEKLVLADSDWKIFNEHIPCDLYRIDKPLTSKWITIGLSRNHQFKNAFSYHILRFSESGILGRMQRNIVVNLSLYKTENELQPIELEQTLQILLLPLMGVMLGTIILVLELICEKARIYKTNRRSFEDVPE